MVVYALEVIECFGVTGDFQIAEETEIVDADTANISAKAAEVAEIEAAEVVEVAEVAEAVEADYIVDTVVAEVAVEIAVVELGRTG